MNEAQHQPWGGHWTKEKLQILHKYLNAFNRALARMIRPDALGTKPSKMIVAFLPCWGIIKQVNVG